MCNFVHMSAVPIEAKRGQWIPLKLVVVTLMCVLGTELGSFEKAGSALRLEPSFYFQTLTFKRELNSGPHAGVTGALLSKPLPFPLRGFFKASWNGKCPGSHKCCFIVQKTPGNWMENPPSRGNQLPSLKEEAPLGRPSACSKILFHPRSSRMVLL